MTVKEKSLSQVRWEDVKRVGSDHYKSGAVEPLDLMKAGGILHDKAVGDIIKYAFRNRTQARTLGSDKMTQDLEKIKHYADILIAINKEYQELCKSRTANANCKAV